MFSNSRSLPFAERIELSEAEKPALYLHWRTSVESTGVKTICICRVIARGKGGCVSTRSGLLVYVQHATLSTTLRLVRRDVVAPRRLIPEMQLVIYSSVDKLAKEERHSTHEGWRKIGEKKKERWKDR